MYWLKDIWFVFTFQWFLNGTAMNIYAEALFEYLFAISLHNTQVMS